jgi:amino acid transporter
LVLVLANFGSGLGGQVGAARLLFGMGRDQVLPARPFAYVSPSNSNPTYNILLIGAAAFAGALVFDYEQAAETLNFGAFLAFMGVNLAALRQFYFLRPAGQRRIWETVLPAAGFLFCLTIWLGLRTPAKVVGGCWLLAGILYSAIQTRGFRLPPPAIRFDSEQDV